MGRSVLATAPWLAALAPALACASPHGAPSDADGGLPEGALTFDLGADFSRTRNPNGPWRYGYTVGKALAVDQFALDSYVPDAGSDPISFWHPADPDSTGAGYYPYVAENSGSASASEEASWALRPQEVAVEGSNSGQYGVIQFVAPVAGMYRVLAHFEGIHFRLSTTDVHVVAGDAGLFASNISGYGGDPAFHLVEGANPTADYEGAVSLRDGDVLSFAVGYGTNMTNTNDTTGLTVRIVLSGN
jgi:hypothetical protein